MKGNGMKTGKPLLLEFMVNRNSLGTISNFANRDRAEAGESRCPGSHHYWHVAMLASSPVLQENIFRNTRVPGDVSLLLSQ